MERNFVVTLARFCRQDKKTFVVQGYIPGNSIAGIRMIARLDDENLPVEISVREGLAVRQKYFAKGIGYEDIDREYDLWITLPSDFERRKNARLRLYQELDGKRACVYRTKVSRMLSVQKKPDGYLETFHDDGDRIRIGGWAVGASPCRIQVLDKSGTKLKSTLTWHYRQDICDNYPEIEKGGDIAEMSFGFECTFDRPASDKVQLIVAADGQKEVYKIDLRQGEKVLTGSTQSMYAKVIAYYKRHGMAGTWKRVIEKLSERGAGAPQNYMSWRQRTIPTKEELEAQSRNVFLQEPLISIVVPLYKTPENYLDELVESIEKQTYKNWELCLSDGSGADSPLAEKLAHLVKRNHRIRVITSDAPLGIAENTNAALHIAEGEYIAFADHDDLLPPSALYECIKQINEDPSVDMIYSDEDKVSMDGKEFFDPHFKTDFNIDLLRSMNYFCHLVVVKRELLEKVGELDPAYDGAQDYDFVLRCVEKAEKICHIPKVLYHWRSHKDSTAENPASKMYAFEAGRRAIEAHLQRTGVDAEAAMGQYPGLYTVTYHVQEPAPLVSIIIPNKDHIDDLDRCLHSIVGKTSYQNYEIIIVENNSTDEKTFAYYKELETDPRIHVLYWEGEFNYSEINNYALNEASGEYLLFLNNDTEMIHEDCIEQLLGPCMRPEVGIVGARMFYEDNTIQHAGVIIGYGGIAGHAFQGMPRTANGYFSRILCQSDLSAVTAACMMVRRSVFEEVGGFDGVLRVAFNDIDLCLKVRETGRLVVYNPNAQLYHYESKSRGKEDTPEKIARFNGEADVFLKRWSEILKNGDPYYNPNLSLDSNDFRLKR